MNQLFSVGAIIFIAFLSATYIPQEYLDHFKSYFIEVTKKNYMPLEPLIETEQLNQLLKHSDFDQNYRLIETFFGSQSEKDFQKEHIPKAIYFDVLNGAKENKLIPKNIIGLKEFEDYVGSLGISNQHHVIIYDRSEFGFFTSTRAWYLFKMYGSDKVTIVNGGLKSWKNQNFETTSEILMPKKEEFKAEFNQNLIRSFEDVAENIKTNKELLIDSRESNEFNVIQPETGKYDHIPNSVNLPYSELFDTKANTLKKISELVQSNTFLILLIQKICLKICIKSV